MLLLICLFFIKVFLKGADYCENDFHNRVIKKNSKNNPEKFLNIIRKIRFFKEKKVINENYFEDRYIFRRAEVASAGEIFPDMRKISLLTAKSVALYNLYYSTFREREGISDEDAG